MVFSSTPDLDALDANSKPPGVRIRRSPDTSKCLLGEAGAKSPLVESHWVRETAGRHQGEKAAPISEDLEPPRGETFWEKEEGVCRTLV